MLRYEKFFRQCWLTKIMTCACFQPKYVKKKAGIIYKHKRPTGMASEMEIVTLNLNHLEKVYQFCLDDFFQDEPLFSSLKIHEGSGFFYNQIMDWFKNDYFKKFCESGNSFGAFDSAGNILGIKLGKVLIQDKTEK